MLRLVCDLTCFKKEYPYWPLRVTGKWLWPDCAPPLDPPFVELVESGTYRISFLLSL